MCDMLNVHDDYPNLVNQRLNRSTRLDCTLTMCCRFVQKILIPVDVLTRHAFFKCHLQICWLDCDSQSMDPVLVDLYYKHSQDSQKTPSVETIHTARSTMFSHCLHCPAKSTKRRSSLLQFLFSWHPQPWLPCSSPKNALCA